MRILIDGKEAVLKKDSSFDLIFENRLFLGRDAYTLNITFPLNDCPKNKAIFGHINRADFKPGKLVYNCEIRDAGVSFSGSISVTGISQSEIKCQFAEGRCEQTVTDPFTETYINDLDLGKPELPHGEITPAEAWRHTRSEVALPWINDEYPLVANNWVIYDGVSYSWNPNNVKLSWMPYLIVIAKRICDAVGYTYDFIEWEQSEYKSLIICNTLPGSWNMPDFKYVMPRWTVSEFFEKLELFLMCEFDIDNRTKHIRFQFSKTALSAVAPVKLDAVLDEFSEDVSHSKEASCEYIGVKRLAYKECDHYLWPYYSCDWLFETDRPLCTYPDIRTMLEKNKRRDSIGIEGRPIVNWGDNDTVGKYGNLRGAKNNIGSLIYCSAEDTYFSFRSIGTEFLYDIGKNKIYTQIYVMQPLNVFGSGIADSDNVSTEEIEFVPPCIMETRIDDVDDMGMMLRLRISTDGLNSIFADSPEASDIYQPSISAAIEAGRMDDGSEFFDCIYVGYWEGAVPFEGKSPFPIIDNEIVNDAWQYCNAHFPGLRLTDKYRNVQSQIPMIEQKRKYKFSWLSTTLPNPRAIFHIKGKRYVCEKITATFTENGMSQLLKGEFYPLVES